MTAAEQLRCSREDVERVCALLLDPTPDAVDGCSPVLEGAVRDLTRLRPALGASPGDPEALAEAWRLQVAVRRAGALLAGASAWHDGWRGVLGSKTAGYGPGGHPGDTPRSGRLCLTG
jgi:hypothetical protein